jgi:hypothetical protein
MLGEDNFVRALRSFQRFEYEVNPSQAVLALAALELIASTT